MQHLPFVLSQLQCVKSTSSETAFCVHIDGGELIKGTCFWQKNLLGLNLEYVKSISRYLKYSLEYFNVGC